jgi:hypothetical protein
MDNQKNKSKSINIKLANKKKCNKKTVKNKTPNNLILKTTNMKKRKLNSEIINIININMEKLQNHLYLDEQDNTVGINNALIVDIDYLKTYSGEKITLMSYADSKSRINKKAQKKTKKTNITSSSITTKKVCNKKNKKEKNKFDYYTNKSIAMPKNKINILLDTFDTNTDEETIINNSNFINLNEKINNYKTENKNKIIDMPIYEINQKTQKKYNKNSYENNNNNNNRLKFSLKDNHNRNLSLYDSTSTSVTLNKFKFHLPVDESYNISNYLKYNKTELANFFTEINLPSTYADKFLDNGFDDLNILLTLTKTSISITNQNLKEIGIKNGGHRAQILIHLEEKAEIIPYILEKDIIYNNKTVICSVCSNSDSDNSLLKFLSKIKCDNYFYNFKRNGYTSSELLFSQMLTRQPITREILIEDFLIDNEYIINIIINGLKTETNNYIKKLKKTKDHKNDILHYHKKNNSCENCLIF